LGRVNFRVSKLLLSVFVASSVSSVFAATALPTCGVGTVASYVTNTSFPGGGCDIGILDYYNFSYHKVSNAPNDMFIGVNPEAGGFSFGPVSAAPGETVQFEIDYDIFIDPVPRIPGASLRLDPPKGYVTVTEYFCNDLQYIYSGSCLSPLPAPTLTVGTTQTGFPPSAQINFANPAAVSQQVGILFTLKGGATGASFDGLDAVSLLSSVPEPASAPVLFLGLLILSAGYLGTSRLRHRSR
jgi:hypothetical protein